MKFSRHSLICLCLLALAPTIAAAEINQTNAQTTNENLNNTASDDDMEAATGSGMKAIMSLAALNIPGAFHYGYKGYGEYRNSQQLDDLAERNSGLAGVMSSLGNNTQKSVKDAGGQGAGKNKSGVSGVTSFSRLKKDFLYKGEVGKVADEFERLSGMKREEFLEHLASATDSNLSYDDPELLEKIVARADVFISRIPNPEFRAGLERAKALVPGREARMAILDKVKLFYFSGKQDGDVPAALAKAETKAEVKERAAESAAAVQPVIEETMKKESERRVASVPSYKKGEVGLFIGMQGEAGAIGEFLQSDRLDSESVSLFQRITIRYRALTPTVSSLPKRGG